MLTMVMMAKLTWDNVRGNEERDPGDDNEKARRQIVGDDVGHHMTLQNLWIIVITVTLMVLLTRSRDMGGIHHVTIGWENWRRALRNVKENLNKLLTEIGKSFIKVS